jgi:hypothetical protein
VVVLAVGVRRRHKLSAAILPNPMLDEEEAAAMVSTVSTQASKDAKGRIGLLEFVIISSSSLLS